MADHDETNRRPRAFPNRSIDDAHQRQGENHDERPA